MAAYSSSCLMKIEFQHCGIVGIFVAFVIEDAHLLPHLYYAIRIMTSQ